MSNSETIRSSFVDFFKSKKHEHLASSSVVPIDDPTLLFINAGMNQFKDIFLGSRKPTHHRAVTSQKCIRVGGKHNDLENVGHTSRHMTFFEMLGNFSFGDYFKKDAISFAFEVTANVFQLEMDRVYVSVFETDDEAYELWKNFFPEDHIVRLGEKDNFWSMGDVGPCGPCSELLYDRGEKYGKATSPLEDHDGERFLEFWNLVFMQYEKTDAGTLENLKAPSIDTGAGLERVVSLKMGVDTVFETDILQSIIRRISDISKVEYNPKHKNAAAFHVIADHIRALSFAIADGAQPSNLDRGYVLRKLLRRACRYGKKLSLNEPFLAQLVPVIVEQMGGFFPEIVKSMTLIQDVVTTEEESFIRTLRKGGNMLQKTMDSSAKNASKMISGDDAFRLKDTYGFPLEEITLIAKDANLSIDVDRFNALEDEAKQRSKNAHKQTKQVVEDGTFKEFLEHHGESTFTGYDQLSSSSSITGIFSMGQQVESLHQGDEAMIVCDSTCFYPEKGGQIGDSGTLSHHNAHFIVSETKEVYTGVIAHFGTLKEGTLIEGEPVELSVDSSKRAGASKNHTATHLLHKALEKHIGKHVKQMGSFLDDRGLRFDFNHHESLSYDVLKLIEDDVNVMIFENHPVTSKELSYSQIKDDPDIKQFFGDKYGEHVRVVTIGEHISKELCGGTHVTSTGTIGLFAIVKESSIAGGVRRIEAVCGMPAYHRLKEGEDTVHLMSTTLKCSPYDVAQRLDHTLEELKLMKSKLKELSKVRLRVLKQQLIQKRQENNGLSYLLQEVNDLSSEDMQQLAHELSQGGVDVVLLASRSENRCQLQLHFSDLALAKKASAKAWIRPIAAHIKGGGGGRDQQAQAGGKDPSNLNLAFRECEELINKL